MLRLIIMRVNFCSKAEYNNSKNYLRLTEDVHIRDIKGEMFADELFFDIKKRRLILQVIIIIK